MIYGLLPSKTVNPLRPGPGRGHLEPSLSKAGFAILLISGQDKRILIIFRMFYKKDASGSVIDEAFIITPGQDYA
ncbi:MAG: hypothetical protein M0R18_06680 [Deltaproteobacteria bacterium]|jgi:hypothetical protein|nr:hypothetical protein [Deltaproteobacteria bacterium]MDX9762662.1 hypothetical protein [Desulfomonilia bacterium]